VKRGEPLKRSGALERRALPKRRSQKRPLAVSDRIKSEGWHAGVEGHLCAVCGRRRAEAGHHIIRVQTLRKEALSRGFDFERVRWDVRNRLAVCGECHERHHKASRRIPLALLRRKAPKVFQFARELGLAHVLQRDYAP
jgi:hypothetical protein